MRFYFVFQITYDVSRPTTCFANPAKIFSLQVRLMVEKF